jgi:hypothetical protein
MSYIMLKTQEWLASTYPYWNKTGVLPCCVMTTQQLTGAVMASAPLPTELWCRVWDAS